MSDDHAVRRSDEPKQGMHTEKSQWISRGISVLAIVAGAGSAILYRQSNSVPDVVLFAPVPVLLLMSLVVDWLLKKAHRRWREERARAEAAHRARQSELEELAGRDDLTQLQNRRFFYHRLQQELERAEVTRKPLSVVMIDVDDLKLLNDEFGHQVGDIVLRNFARILNRHAGPSCVTARLGGDEFAVILPETDRRTAEQFGWRLWDELASGPIHENQNASIYLGVSLGVGGYPWGEPTWRRSFTGRTPSCTPTSWSGKVSRSWPTQPRTPAWPRLWWTSCPRPWTCATA